MPQGLALRLLVEARSTAVPAAMEQTRATA
jgi:hypothetical protein